MKTDTAGVCFLLLIIPSISFAAKILVVMSIPSFSHQNTYNALWRELSLRSHQVTSMTPNIINDTSLVNLTEIDWHGSYDVLLKMSNFKDFYTHTGLLRPYRLITGVFLMVKAVTEYQMSMPEVKELVFNNKTAFDLVIVEYMSPFMLAFAARFNCPAIGLVPIDGYYLLHDIMGNPTHPVLYPNFDMTFNAVPTFLDRILNVLCSIIFRWHLLFNKEYDTLMRMLFNLDESFTLADTLDYMKFAFINANPIFYNTRPLSPGTINIGGWSHMRKEKPLPQDLKVFLDGASEGAIYFSLGTNVKASELSNHTIEVFTNVFSGLPYRVLWKSDLDIKSCEITKIKTAIWFPQQDVFRHPNVKLFITHGGLQSMEEALYNHIPMIGMPMFGDQFNNVMKMVDKGFGLRLDSKVDKSTLREAILEVVNNPKYKQKARQLAELMLDRPADPIEQAVWWTEYLIRHKNEDLSHLKGQKLEWYKYFLLDIVSLAIIICSIVIISFILTVVFVKRLLRAFVNKNKLKTL